MIDDKILKFNFPNLSKFDRWQLLLMSKTIGSDLGPIVKNWCHNLGKSKNSGQVLKSFISIDVVNKLIANLCFQT